MTSIYIQKTLSFFSLKELKTAFILALCFSLFIYLFHFGFELYALNTVLGLYAFYLLLLSNRKTLLFAGFFIGLLWFYWIGFSFIYYNLAWVVPLNALGFALIYAFIFWIVSWPSNVFLRALMLFLLSLFEPFDFNWLQPELLFIHSYLGVEKWHYALILLTLSLFIFIKNSKRYLALILLLPVLSFSQGKEQKLPLNIELIQTHLEQDIKWNPSYTNSIIQSNLEHIDKAIEKGVQLVILPESAFPLFLNHHSDLLKQLKEKSQKISIVTGSLYAQDGHNFNATYFFEKGKLTLAKKMILVPFGEYIPLPSFLAKPINKAIFGGAVDYLSATKPTYFNIQGHNFKNAICYEATCHELYEDQPNLMIATSNNAWFMPSIEPTIQRLLMQFYATKNNTIILHAANKAGGGIIYP
ncbi:apolipoprotein N-acyltransferase [Sulfurimonas sp. MAG313]|nr:apolipoprotein N-acyltransferase [Sulfurimonas sp. MAG313]MDF1881808.1 apolipoprotein N-acyltransferase [Sulfurimonas sp. MAG313]